MRPKLYEGWLWTSWCFKAAALGAKVCFQMGFNRIEDVYWFYGDRGSYRAHGWDQIQVLGYLFSRRFANLTPKHLLKSGTIDP